MSSTEDPKMDAKPALVIFEEKNEKMEAHNFCNRLLDEIHFGNSDFVN